MLERSDREALVVGMTLVPNLVSRNRSFALFEDQDVRRAKARAALLRGIVRHLAGATGRVESLHIAHAIDECELTYALPGVRLLRSARLAGIELACVRVLAGRLGVTELRATDEDRAMLETSLRSLARGLRLAEIDVGKATV
ncbi:MAG: hypothetical protein ABTD50_22495 [Polyangiaceae bacterium]